MTSACRIALLFMIVFILLPRPQPTGPAPVGRISALSGDVHLLHREDMLTLKRPGRRVYVGDVIQTGRGTAEVTFDDDARLKINAHTSAEIEEPIERKGLWLFKVRKTVRRLPYLVGRLWFKSETGDAANHLQTPTAVCGLRASAAGSTHPPLPPHPLRISLKTT